MCGIKRESLTKFTFEWITYIDESVHLIISLWFFFFFFLFSSTLSLSILLFHFLVLIIISIITIIILLILVILIIAVIIIIIIVTIVIIIVIVLNYPLIFFLKCDDYFPTNWMVISINVFMIVNMLQYCDLGFAVTAFVHHIISPWCLHSISRPSYSVLAQGQSIAWFYYLHSDIKF